MVKVTLDNSDNDKLLDIVLPIVPRIGDWIDVPCYFSDEGYVKVRFIILRESLDIKVVVSDEGE